jgi:hypothetical protein
VVRGGHLLRAGVVAAFACATLLLGSASAAPASLSGSIERIAGGIRVTLKNEGPSTYKAVRVTMVSTVHHTGARTANGDCGPGISAIDVLCVLPEGLAPGQSVAIEISTDAVYPVNGGGQAWAAVQPGQAFEGPFVLVGPKAAASCRCRSLDVAGTSFASGRSTNPRGATRNLLVFRWVLTCVAGEGDDCAGEFTVAAPRGTDFVLIEPADTTVSCRGRCSTGTSSIVRGSVKFRWTSQDSFDVDDRAGKTFTFVVRKRCIVNGKKIPASLERIKLGFDKNGFLRRSLSDLNGDGKLGN